MSRNAADPGRRGGPSLPGAGERGAILVVVMIMILFTAAALVVFLDKASNDLLVAARVATAERLRKDAYSSLEVTLAVLEDFIQADGGLHNAGEGWGDPLGWANWSPEDGNNVDVSFQDESAKLPLIRVNSNTLVNLFQYWKMSQVDAEHLADVLLGWMHRDYTPSTGTAPNYEQAAIAYDAPLRAMRSYGELAAIDFAKDVFYDADGRPNDLWWRFVNDFSLFNYQRPNINGATRDILAALGEFSDDQQRNLSNYMKGTGNYAATNPLGAQWFLNTDQVTGVVGSEGDAAAFATTISALRVFITVHQGASQFRLSAVVAPLGGARTVETTATDVRIGTQNSTTGETNTGNGLSSAPAEQSTDVPTAAQTAAASTETTNLRYPFTILEIFENDQILTPPPPEGS
jgi:general secretion pathway protein K